MVKNGLCNRKETIGKAFCNIMLVAMGCKSFSLRFIENEALKKSWVFTVLNQLKTF